MSFLTLSNVLSTAASVVPDRKAVVTNRKTLTYFQLDRRSTAIAHDLLNRGHTSGEHIAIHSRNSTEWIEIFYAILKIGAIPININYRYLDDELKYIYKDSISTCSFVSLDYFPALLRICPELTHLRTIIPIDTNYEEIANSDNLSELPQINSNDLYILYTGGTTGMPKGVVWRQSDLIHAAMNAYRGHRPIVSLDQLAEEIQQSPNYPKFMAIGPLMHGTSQWMMGTCFLSGGTFTIYTDKSFSAHSVLSLLEYSQSDSLCLVGDAMASPFIDALQENTNNYDLSSLFLITNAAAPLSLSNRNKIKQLLPNIILLDSYGSSELGSIGSSFDSDVKLPTFNLNQNINVFDSDNKPCRLGHVGKLARTGHIPLGYWNDTIKTSEMFFHYNNQSWLYSGDWAILETDNKITLLGRGSICINSGGEKIYPEEVEHYIKLYPNISDAIVCGVPDLKWGQLVCALVVADQSFDTEDLQEFLRNKISSYKIPKKIYIVSTIQKTESCKPDYSWAIETISSLIFN